MLKSAASDMAASIEELKFNLATQAKGGNSWYYDDVRVRAGYDPDPLPPKPGDTLLHMVRFCETKHLSLSRKRPT